MYTFYQKMALKGLCFQIYCVLKNIDDRQYTNSCETYLNDIVRLIAETFDFDFVAFHEDNEANYQNPELHRTENPYINFTDKHYNVLRKIIETIRIQADIVKESNPYSTERQLYEFVNRILPEQFGFSYYEHVAKKPLYDIEYILKEEGFVEEKILGQTIWAYPPNILKDKSACVSSIFKFQAEAIFYAFGKDFLREQLNFRKKTMYELWQERLERDKTLKYV